MEGVPIPVVVAVLLHRHRVFLMKRGRERPLSGQWEFPGGKVSLGEPPIDALRRELDEELRLRVGGLALFGAYSHVYEFPEGPIHYVLLAYRADPEDGVWSRRGRWMNAADLANARIVEGSRPIISDLLSAHLVR